MAATHRRRAIRVEALQYSAENLADAVKFVGQAAVQAYGGGRLEFLFDDEVVGVDPGDWLVKDTAGTLLPPCSPETFARVYEPLDAPA